MKLAKLINLFVGIELKAADVHEQLDAELSNIQVIKVRWGLNMKAFACLMDVLQFE